MSAGFEPLRVSTDALGHHDLRTGERNSAPDSGLIASCVRDDYIALFQAAPELLAVLLEVVNTSHGLTMPSSAYLAAESAIAKATGATS